MIILGLLLLVAVAGVSLAVIWTNDGAFTAPAGAIELFESQMNLTMGQTFLAGVTAGALTLLGLFMVFGGLSRNARRRSAGRHKLNDQRQEMQDLQRKHDTVSSDFAAHRAATDAAAEDSGVTARR
jgi:outer membrane murein-binding lipoprotein Lpp